MIGPVKSYQSIYVSACGRDFPSHKEGIEHEQSCIACARANEPESGTLEYCLACGEPTGRAGRGEDSIYCDDCGSGPFCEECHEQHSC